MSYKSRTRRRLRIRWIDDVLEDLRRIDVRGYAKKAMDRRTLEKIGIRSQGLCWTVVLMKKKKIAVVEWCAETCQQRNCTGAIKK